jgi:hypothetical protein
LDFDSGRHGHGSSTDDRVESVSSQIQEAAVLLLNAATVSNPPDCRRIFQTGSMSAMAEFPSSNATK